MNFWGPYLFFTLSKGNQNFGLREGGSFGIHVLKQNNKITNRDITILIICLYSPDKHRDSETAIIYSDLVQIEDSVRVD